MTSQAPIVGLHVQSRPQSLTLVRGMLSGVAEQLAMDPELLDDLKTSVSEACNNVVLHAYAGEPGPMERRAVRRSDDDGIVVSVQDRGVGLPDPPAAIVNDGAGGLGVSVMQALARDLELTARPGGGTEVLMRFDGQRDGRPLFTMPSAPTADHRARARRAGRRGRGHGLGLAGRAAALGARPGRADGRGDRALLARSLLGRLPDHRRAGRLRRSRRRRRADHGAADRFGAASCGYRSARFAAARAACSRRVPRRRCRCLADEVTVSQCGSHDAVELVVLDGR